MSPDDLGGVSHQGHVGNDVQKNHHKGSYSCIIIIEPDTLIIYESEVILKENNKKIHNYR
jgi:hypothetical protein